MPSSILHRSLTTIHATMQNSTGVSNSTYTPTMTSSKSHSHNGLLSGLLVALNVLLIIILYVFLYKYFFRKQPSSSSHHHSTATTGTPDSSPPTSPRSCRALEILVLDSIPVVEFKSTEKAAECAVCLAEFKDGENVRVLPQCSHRFHVECVDMWFRSHANCPLCRTMVEEKAAAGAESMV